MSSRRSIALAAARSATYFKAQPLAHPLPQSGQGRVERTYFRLPRPTFDLLEVSTELSLGAETADMNFKVVETFCFQELLQFRHRPALRREFESSFNYALHPVPHTRKP